MGFFSKLFKGPEVDQAKSDANGKKMRRLFDQVVENGDRYRLIFGYTEDVSRFNYGFVHGSKTKIGNLIVGWNEAEETVAVVPTVPLRLRGSHLLPPPRDFEGLPQQVPHRRLCHLPRPEGVHRHQRLRLAGRRVPVRLRVPGGGAGGLYRLLHEPLCQKVRRAVTLGGIGALLLALVIVFALGRVWFRLVEAVREGIRRRLFPLRDPPTWHPLPEEDEREE